MGQVADVDLHCALLAVASRFLCFCLGMLGERTYIAPKTRWRGDFIGAVEQRIKHIRRVVDLLDIGDRLDRRAEDQCWEEDGDGEMWFVFFHKFPDGFVGFFFAYAVGDVMVLGFLGVFYCELCEFVSFYLQVGLGYEGERTGSQDSLVKTRVLTSSPVVIAFMEPVTAIALTFLPYLRADSRISVFLVPAVSPRSKANGLECSGKSTHPLTFGRR